MTSTCLGYTIPRDSLRTVRRANGASCQLEAQVGGSSAPSRPGARVVSASVLLGPCGNSTKYRSGSPGWKEGSHSRHSEAAAYEPWARREAAYQRQDAIPIVDRCLTKCGDGMGNWAEVRVQACCACVQGTTTCQQWSTWRPYLFDSRWALCARSALLRLALSSLGSTYDLMLKAWPSVDSTVCARELYYGENPT